MARASAYAGGMTAALWTSFATITGVWLITVISPGPNFLATVYTTASQSRRLGLLVSLGIAAGTTVWATASLLGLSLLFETATWLYQAVKLAGALFLIYLGLRTILSARRLTVSGSAPVAVVSGVQAFRRGLVVDLSNPKAAVFFASLFAVTVPPGAPVWFQATVVAAVVAMAGGWYALVACIVDLDPIARLLRRTRRAFTFAAGAIFVALGLRLATDR